MIQLNELRIGNLVGVLLSPNDTNPPITVRVNSIDEHRGVLVDGLDLIFEFSHLHPIPLTEEWFLRLGFEKITLDGGGYWYELGCLVSSDNLWFGEKKEWLVGVWHKGDYMLEDEIQKCEYVHEVQNLHFALTGQELETRQQ